MTNINTIIEIIKPSEILVKSSNYLQAIVNDKFCEFQKCYIEQKWYQFESYGKSDSPNEKFIKWVN